MKTRLLSALCSVAILTLALSIPSGAAGHPVAPVFYPAQQAGLRSGPLASTTSFANPTAPPAPIPLMPTVPGDEKWSPNFTPGGANSAVVAIATDNDNNILYIGGYFTAVAGVRAAHIAAFDGRDWYPGGGGFDGLVLALVYDPVHKFL